MPHRGPFAKPRGWLAWGLLGVVLSPFVVGTTAALFSAAGYDVCCISYTPLFDSFQHISCAAVQLSFRRAMHKRCVMHFLGWQGVGGRGTADGVAAIISLDLPTYLSLFSVTAILAPLLEEVVFRGFLLTTLTRWVPTPVAIVVPAPPCICCACVVIIIVCCL